MCSSDLVIDFHEQVVFYLERALNLLTQDALVKNILDADAHSIYLVGICRADASARGADLTAAQEPLGDLVKRAVIARDDVCVGTHPQAGHVDSARREGRELTKQNLEVNHDAVRDYGSDARRQDARGEQVQGVFLVTDDDCVTRIIAAVELDHVVDPARQEVGRFALTLVAPLGSHENDCWHDDSPRRCVGEAQDATCQ
ncbi:unannotated protein [freshwater metagenome]|uniref:Unannotated protein n=1 Tax=freshwater metagenome TaxID=449393 RepID=A0A6J7GUX4_9ZZZZ